VPAVVEDFRPVVERNLDCSDPAHKLSWRYLFLHMEFTRLLSHALRAKAEGRISLTRSYGQQVLEYLQLNEEGIQPVFDLAWFMRFTMARIFGLPAKGMENRLPSR
jgi:hypothetical protein